MKKIPALFLCVLLIAGTASGARQIEEITPKVSGVIIDDTYMAIGESVTTDGIIITENVGFAAVSLDLTPGSDVDVSFQVSHDDITYWTPKDTSNATLGDISTAITEDRWIRFTPQPDKFMRFILDPDADTKLEKMRFMFLKEKP